MPGDILTFFLFFFLMLKVKNSVLSTPKPEQRDSSIYKMWMEELTPTGPGDGEGGRGEGVGFCAIALAGELSSLKEHSRLLGLPEGVSQIPTPTTYPFSSSPRAPTLL